jgi:hypothetical protein
MYGISHLIPIVGAVTGTVLLGPRTTDPSTAALAFTGIALGLYLGIAGSLLAVGLIFRLLGRRSARHSTDV